MEEIQKKNNPASLRPRFKLEVEQSPEKVYKSIEENLKLPDCPVIGHAIPGYASMQLPAEERQMWSPILTLTIEELEDGNRLIRGTCSPSPGIWTLFMFLYVILGFSLFILLIWQFSNYTLGQEMEYMWWAVLILLSMLSLWIFARIGQRLSAHQMQIMQTVLEQALHLATEKEKD